MAEQIKAGDVVTLKSGGPHMTVECLPSTETASVRWFCGDEVRGFDFEIVALKLVFNE